MANQFSKDEELQLIVFKLATEEYTVPITCVQEIIMPQKPVKLPKSPSFVEGVINLRGKIIPIIDGRKKFGMETSEATNDTRIMVLEFDLHTIGVIVDSVSEVIYVNTNEIEKSPMAEEDTVDFIQGICKYKNRLLILIDGEKVLNTHEIESIKQTAAMAKNISSIANQMA
ncbi:MAG: chemotaxis protein CheW [bacterium]